MVTTRVDIDYNAVGELEENRQRQVFELNTAQINKNSCFNHMSASASEFTSWL